MLVVVSQRAQSRCWSCEVARPFGRLPLNNVYNLDTRQKILSCSQAFNVEAASLKIVGQSLWSIWVLGGGGKGMLVSDLSLLCVGEVR